MFSFLKFQLQMKQLEATRVDTKHFYLYEKTIIYYTFFLLQLTDKSLTVDSFTCSP